MPGDVFDLVGVGLVQRRIVQDQQALAPIHHRFGFPPQRLRVWRPSLKQAREGIMGRSVLLPGVGAGRFGTGKFLLRRNQKVDVVEVVNLRRIHRWNSSQLRRVQAA